MKRKQPLLVGLLVVALAVLVVALLRMRGTEPAVAVTRAGHDAADVEPAEPQLESVPADEMTAPMELAANERTVVDDHLGELPVRVLDQSSELPLARVPVSLERKDDDSRREQTTGDDGRCRFEALPPGEYTLQTSAREQEDYAGEPTPVAVVESAHEEVVLHVERRWFLAGTVVEKGSGRPVAGVDLMARGADGRFQPVGASSEDGGFRSRKSFPAGPLGMFLAQNVTMGLMRTHGDGPELLQVTVGQEDVSHLTVELDWLGVVEGIVLDERDVPIEDAEVRILAADSIYLANATLRYWGLYEGMRGLGRIARSDAGGRFRFERLPNDRLLVVVASAPGFVASRSPDLSPPFLTRDDDVVLQLPEGGAITGTVLDARGEPLKEAQVFALSTDCKYQPDPTRSDAEGAFRFAGLKPGPTEVTARARGTTGMPVAIASGEIEVVAGQEVELILQAGADGVHIRGVAVDQDGLAITGDREVLKVRARPLEPRPGERTWGTDTPVEADGTFDVTVGREGGYSLTLLARAAGDRWEAQEVQAPADDVRLTFPLRPKSELTLRIVDAESGELIGAADYSIRWAGGSIGGNLFGGVHVMAIREGSYTLSADAEGYAPSTVQLDLRGQLKPTTLVEIRLERGRAVSGIVVDAAGQPVQGCTIVLSLGGMLQTRNMVYSDADGRFTIPSAPLSGGSVCAIDEHYRTIASVEIGADDVVLTVDGN